MHRRYCFIMSISVLLVGLIVPAAWAQSEPEISGIQWQWAALTETEPAGQSVVPDPQNYVLVLNADGSASIKADCNMVQWTYTLEGDSLTFNTLGPSTLAYCGDESSDQLYLQKLGMGGAVSLDGDRLVLDLNEDAGRMVFDNGGSAKSAPESVPETGGVPLAAPWVMAVLAGLATLGAGTALKQR